MSCIMNKICVYINNYICFCLTVGCLRTGQWSCTHHKSTTEQVIQISQGEYCCIWSLVLMEYDREIVNF